ncbi:helix-turn-helix domain-containing protein [Rhodoferax antarcticus]|uniref:helix-turn-helix domain-containing protein n=1 Tax=Rhodoferax antarcticus TaxID=81479 RepID=UPI0022250DD1|nr:helix-turn-helix domain-containing protein [Rhodoferax antarcticus]MCW2314079.1 transcriptional regulator with XRE-family HTH domain/SAM-dependent methyltransferase [Rhodoferax antarcticus]
MSRSTVHRNIAHFRAQRGLTLTGLSERSGIAKSTLSQLENGDGNPTIDTLWAIANALGVSFGQLVDNDAGSSDLLEDGVVVRFIEKSTTDPEIEVYSMELRPDYRMDSVPHPAGVRERVTVLSGSIYVGQMDRPRLLHSGDSHCFTADVPHFYATKEQGARVHVVIEYPSKLFVASTRTIYLNWPTTPSQWDGVQAAIDRMLTEVSNGLDARVLRFRGGATASAKAELCHKIAHMREQGFKWPLFFAVETDEQGPYLAVIRLHWTRKSVAHAAKGAGQCLSPSVDVLYLAALAESPSKELDEAQIRQISENLSASSWTLSTLAAEVLLQRGQIAIPSQLKNLSSRQASDQCSPTDGAFSSRINVDHYDAFELLHPGYARQVVAVAQDIYEFSGTTEIASVLDVGTGPGVPLMMLREMLPKSKFIAIEPDDVAISCLRSNIKGMSDIEALQTDFLSYDGAKESISVITSVGASHHFNTAFMLQKAMRLLRPDGLLVVADEFLPPYESQDERTGALVFHHSAYLLHSMQWIGDGAANDSDAERSIYQEFRQTLTHAWLAATEGNNAQAVAICRRLYQKLRNSGLSKKPDCDLGAFNRFFWLELQAMVAGFDYEVEQKSHPRRFAEIAAFAGLELLSQRRVFATIGYSDWAGGTHVFTFRKPGVRL